MKTFLIPSIATATLLTGCTNIPKNMPLVFGESITVGISIGATAADQGADLTIGFKSRDVAVIPVVAYKDDGTLEHIQSDVTETIIDREETITEEPKDGNDIKTKKTVTKTPKDTTHNKDAYSVLGQFESSTDGSGRRIGLGKFFATGWAAQTISDGFKACLSSNSCNSEPK